jgi:scytalone dehydratase
MTAQQFQTMVSDETFLGKQRLKTQHAVGVGKWVQTGDDEITGNHQMSVARQEYKDDELTEVVHKSHAHGNATVWYRKIDGAWKFAGIQPEIRWIE